MNKDLLEANKDPVPELVKNDRLKRIDLIEATHQYNNSPYVDLDNVTIIDWDTIKNDTASFIDDVISQARDNVDIFDLFD